ncbi:hypothetical protein E0E50_15265 [Azotobacter chroococcum subsp. isscasi]|uniref:IS66 family insertion sequence element accessory protein TnpB n=1 Tax=Azotobacter chroococcum TaxID=353 RepID=UPI001039183B|nr:IS66 family insertion sequence element accessory protein TnpB [Azotobacter chroococcum]TBW08317.1 hypothetical protein E0E50_15265 [Azotobacter chroococcum subsp. isscasi]
MSRQWWGVSLWLASEPLDMRAGTKTALARVVAVFGAAKPHNAYLFANKRANRMKVLVHDGFGVWLASRRLNWGSLSSADSPDCYHLQSGVRHEDETELLSRVPC